MDSFFLTIQNSSNFGELKNYIGVRFWEHFYEFFKFGIVFTIFLKLTIY